MQSEPLSSLAGDPVTESPEYLQNQLITYIGSKRSLLPFIGQGIEKVKARLCKDKLECLDLFSGTGVVARYLKQHASRLIVNDIELYSQITNRCYLSNPSEIDPAEIREALQFLLAAIDADWSPGFIAELYAPRSDEQIRPGERAFYTRRNAEYLDTARTQIARLPERLQVYFLAPLIAQASVHANTSGVFKGFYKSRNGVGRFGGQGEDALTRIKKDIELAPPIFSRFDCEYSVERRDANDFFSAVGCEDLDLAYFDPPYNQHPYGSNYFMLNLIATYQRPRQVSEISGIPTDWNRSRYNQRREAELALIDVVEQCPAKFVLVSYNSEGFVPHERFIDVLRRNGRLSVLETPYNTFRGSRNLGNRPRHVTEFLYLLEK